MSRLRPAILVSATLSVLLALGSGCGCRREASPAAKSATPAKLPNRTIRALCYHHLAPTSGNLYDLSVKDFTAQMQALKDGGYQAVTCRQVADYLAGVQDLPAKAVLITFDDGRKSVLTVAKPILDRFGFRANLFLITATVGGKGNLTWDDVKVLQAAGYDIGSHTASHSNLTRRGKSETAAAHQERIKQEITRSYMTLEEKLGAAPAALAYPYGNYDAACMQAVKDAGYQVAFSIDPGAFDQGAEPTRLPRKMIVNGTSPRTFERILAGEPLHLAEVEPAPGQRIAGKQYQLTARAVDGDAVSGLSAEGGRGGKLTVDAATSTLTYTATLSKGANLLRVFSPGPPRRETGWIVVCDP